MLKWVEEAVQASKVHLLSTDHLSMAVNTWQIPFDPSLKEVTVSLSGPSPAMEIHNPLGEVLYTFFCDNEKREGKSLLIFYLFPNNPCLLFAWRKLENFLILSTSSHLHLCYYLSLHSELLDTSAFHLVLCSLNHHLRIVHDGWVLCKKSSTMVWLLLTENIQNQTCLPCLSPAEQCVMGSAVTDLELICN